MKLVGILLIVFGVVALALGGIQYTTREKVLDIGPLEATRRAQDHSALADRRDRIARRRYRARPRRRQSQGLKGASFSRRPLFHDHHSASV
jgi:hypothetical protein